MGRPTQMFDRAQSWWDTNRAVAATAIVFAVNGLTLGSWVSRVPAARDTLDLTTAQMGVLLLAPGIGTLIGLPLGGAVVARLGPRTALLVGTVGTTTALIAMIGGLAGTSAPVVAFGLGLYGLGIGLWDVAMNVAGGRLEKRAGRPLLPLLHAGLSLGTIIGSAIGVIASAASVSVATQLTFTAVAAAAGVVFAAAHIPRDGPEAETAHDSEKQGTLSLTGAWRESRTVLIGITVLAFALCEGIAGNWLALALVDGHHRSETIGALGYAVFIVALTVGRAGGPVLLDRVGRVGALRLLAVMVGGGVLLVVYCHQLVLVMLGCVLWGLGASLGFPVGMSAAADDSANAAIRVSVVSWIGYGAFFCAPPLVAYLIEHLGTLPALLSVVVASLVAMVTAASTRPVPQFQDMDRAIP
ncbi:MFS transporter [Nocardia sp. NPDC048505]|uniref:MFS transporter n=1 Tax=Nocardia sp. NPDC048505 TaxID=3155756 RepID=UPI0033F0E069